MPTPGSDREQQPERHGPLHDRTSTSTTPGSTIHLAASDSVFVRGSIFDANEFLPFGSASAERTLFPAFGYNLRTHTDNLSATWTHVFSTSWLNELRFGWMWVGGGEISPNAGNNFAATDGLQGVSANPLDTGYPDVTITGFSTMGESTQYVSRKDNDYEIYDNVIWHHGTHTVKFGGYFFHLDFEPVNANNARGTFAIHRQMDWQCPGRFPAGRSESRVGGVARAGKFAGPHQLGAPLHRGRLADYSQPQARYRHPLRIQPERHGCEQQHGHHKHIWCRAGRLSLPATAQGKFRLRRPLCSANIPPAFRTSLPRRPDGITACFKARPLRLAPRIGLAWALPDHKTVIRSGFGIYTNQAAYSIIQNAALNLPFYFAKTVNEQRLVARTAHLHTRKTFCTANRLVQREQHQPRFQNRVQQCLESVDRAEPLLDHIIPGAIHRVVYRPCRQRDLPESLPGQLH